MSKVSKYTSKPVDSKGYAQYSKTEEETWQFLVKRQNELVKDRGCREFLRGLEILNFSDKIPQHFEITSILEKHTGWGVEPVPAIIPAEEFFKLLSRKRFPTANFIRVPEEIDYLEEPDIFHEIYGHCPLLTNQNYADYMQEYGKLALTVKGKERMRLFRLFWFTIEFGLLKENDQYRAYGGGILSSKNETIYSIDSKVPEYQYLDTMTALRTPYRIDILQPIYFYVNNLPELFNLLENDLVLMARESLLLGDFAPRFAPKDKTEAKSW